MDDLPDNFDMIVVGTGMPECIIAAAAARAGKSVLHLDRNEYYGGDWASFNFDQLLNYFGQQQELPENSSDRMMEALWLEQLDDNESIVLCQKRKATALNIVKQCYIRDKPVAVAQPSTSSPVAANDAASCSGLSENQTEAAASDSQEISVDEIQLESTLTNETVNTETSNLQDQAVSSTNESACETSSNSEKETAADDSTSTSPSNVPEKRPVSDHQTPREWTMEDLKENRRKFNLDLSPKLLFARGSLVELLITSNIARYAEFQCVNRVLTYINGHLEQVPCSRADVFSTKNVSVVEKRMLMKLLTFCLEYQTHPDEFRGYEGKPFLEFLRSRKVTPNIEHYVLHAIAMVDESCPTLQGLSATQKFIESLGRYGNSPFLWSCFGSAELPQCFCRLCAVFGGIYYLKRDIDAVILDSENKCAAVITHGKKIKCQSLVMESSYSPLQYVPQSDELISRAIYITDSTVLPAERQQNTLLRLPPITGDRNVITVLEFGSMSFICPDHLYAVHMICKSLHESVEDDFKSAEKDLFKPFDSDVDTDSEVAKISKPKVLWCVYFRQRDTTVVDVNSNTPDNVFLTSSPGPEQDYEHAVAQAREVFEKLYPGEEFLPRAPDPEDIIMDEASNPGDKEEFGEDNPELRNIENDVKIDDQNNDDAEPAIEKKNNDQSNDNVDSIIQEKTDALISSLSIPTDAVKDNINDSI